MRVHVHTVIYYSDGSTVFWLWCLVIAVLVLVVFMVGELYTIMMAVQYLLKIIQLRTYTLIIMLLGVELYTVIMAVLYLLKIILLTTAFCNNGSVGRAISNYSGRMCTYFKNSWTTVFSNNTADRGGAIYTRNNSRVAMNCLRF